MFEAKFPGSCDACDEDIKVGDVIHSHGTTGYAHVVCPDPVPVVERTPCADCFQVPAANGLCGCDE